MIIPVDRLLLIDGSNLLFQMFYGMPSRIVNHEGRPIQGTLGFVGALLKMIRMTCPTHVAVLFDGEHSNPRKELDAAYKANRPDFSEIPEEETPFSQLPDIFSALRHLEIPFAETENCETDDWMAGYALHYGGERQVIIASQDSDFFQLIAKNVFVLRYRGDDSRLCTEQYVRDKFGVSPSRYADLKALVGDTADNIRGIKGVGPKTAAALLTEYGSLEGIFENVQGISKKGLRESLTEGAERLHINASLIKLTKEVSLPFSLAETVYFEKKLSSREVLGAIGVIKLN